VTNNSPRTVVCQGGVSQFVEVTVRVTQIFLTFNIIITVKLLLISQYYSKINIQLVLLFTINTLTTSTIITIAIITTPVIIFTIILTPIIILLLQLVTVTLLFIESRLLSLSYPAIQTL
jgi:hypothetical protein